MSFDEPQPKIEGAPPSPFVRTAGVAIAHSEKWGTAWFGLLFIGSVLGAIATQIWPHTNAVGITLASMGLGLLVGIVAHVRGDWL